MDRYDIERIVLHHLRAVADGAVAAVAGDLALGSSGVRADVAVLADEFIGFAIRSAGDTLDDLGPALRSYARYFDRVAVVVDPAHLASLRSADLEGASLWAVTAGRELVEHVRGAPNSVGVSATVDLLPIEDRRALLRPLVPQGPVYDRADPPISPTQVRAHFERLFARDHGEAAALLWAA